MGALTRGSVIAAALLGSLALSSCAGVKFKASVSCSRTFPDGHTKCTASGSASKTFGDNIQALISQSSGGNLPDASEFSMDVSGSTVPYPSNGQVTVTLTDGSTGSVVAAKLFSWVKSGSDLVFSNPAAVNAWVADIASPADEVSYHLVPFDTQLTPGGNTIAVSTEYEGQTLASAVSHICYSPHTPPTSGKPLPCL